MRKPRPRLPRLSRDQLGTVGRIIVRVLADSNRTSDIIEAEELTAQTALRELLTAGVFENDEGRALLAHRPHIPSVDLNALRALPPSTLGGTYARFLDRHGLDLSIMDGLPTPHTEDPDASYLLSRIRQSHDVWHTLLGLGTQGYEEVLVHAFSLAQTGFPSSVLIVALGGIKHIVLEARLGEVRSVARAYHHGRRAAPLLSAYWERQWDDPLTRVRERYGVVPL